jgi:hypothetical protein
MKILDGVGNFLYLGLGSGDLLILLFLLIATIVYTLLFVTRGKLIPMLVGTYMAWVLVQYAPFLSLALAQRFGFQEIYTFKLLVFSILFVLIFWVLSRVIFQSPVGSETFGIIPSIFLALSQSGFLTAVIVSFLPHQVTRHFAVVTNQLFAGANALFYWALAPVALLLILGRKANQEVG